MTQNAITENRLVWLDVIRCIAMLMVIGVHCIDPFYISPTMRVIPEYTHWAAIYGSLLRPSVPLFVMMTGLLLLPIKQQPLGAYYKKRIYRVLFPFLIWSVLYSMFPWFTGLLGLPKEIIGDFFCYTQGHESQSLMDSLKDVAMIPFNFSHKENHMWYIYLLIGLYLYLPVFSAWVEKASERAKLIFLVAWGVTLLLPYYYQFVSVYLWGTCSWNSFGMLYAFAGFNGYLLLGHYLRNIEWSMRKTLVIGIPMFAAGYCVTFFGFRHMTALPEFTDEMLELFFTYCSINVVMMTIPVFMLAKKAKVRSEKVRKALANLTVCGFGVYMIHYFFTGPSVELVRAIHVPIPLQIPVAAVVAFIVSWMLVRLIYRTGRIAKYIVG